MKLCFVSVEDSITAIGFRKVVAVAREIHPETEICYVVPRGMRQFFKLLLKKDEISETLSAEEIQSISSHLAESDIVCFSSMTPFADVTKKIIDSIRTINPNTYIVWGGVHPILNSEDAIQYADAICVGEGETAFRNFLTAYEQGKDFTCTKNFWFSIKGEIIKNDFLPLQLSSDMEKFPPPVYADNELIYKKNKGFVSLELNEYVRFNDLVYNAVWTIGCPNKCTYCSNSRFLENDIKYGKLRYPSVDYIIAEIKGVIAKHPHISTVRFHDDCFMAIPSKVLEEFAEKWRKEINIPFWVYGLMPSFVRRKKLKILIRAGMNRVRMGVQSGSDNILEFYKRANRPGLLADSMSILGEFSKYMIAPFYDIIVDNPIETGDDTLITLNLLYNAPRPYRLFVYSLRIIPGTEMEKDFNSIGISVKYISEGYVGVKPTSANAMIYMLSFFRPPRWIYNCMVNRIYTRESKVSPFFPIIKMLYKLRLTLDMLKSLDFSVFPGKFGWFMWKSGIVGFIQRRRMKKAWNISSN